MFYLLLHGRWRCHVACWRVSDVFDVMCALCRIGLSSCTVSGLPMDPVKLAHAVAMAVAWGIMLPTGVIIARFCKLREPRTGPKAFWFHNHKRLQYTGVTLACIGFALALYLKRSGPHFSNLHSQLGLAVMFAGK